MMATTNLPQAWTARRGQPHPRLGVHLFPLLILLGCGGAGAASAAVPEAARRPNVVIIMADDLGWHELGSSGETRYATPHTDRLAREGMRFTDAHSPSAVCSPTRYAVLTGTNPYRRYHTTHVLFNGEPLVIGPQEPTLATLLQSGGYRTGVVGKWHLGLGDALPRDLNRPGRGPNEIGFDYAYILPDGPDMSPRCYLENGRIEGATGNDYPSKPTVNPRVRYSLIAQTTAEPWPNRRPGEQIGARLAARADAFIEGARRGPFLLYYPTCSIHLPHQPDPRFVGKSGLGAREDYVMEFDWTVGRVLQTLDRLGLAENTLLIVTSDNGGQLEAGEKSRNALSPNRPWRGGKGMAREGGHRIPLLVRWPGKIEAGAVNDTVVSLVDLLATACAAAGVALPPAAALDSHDLLPVLLGRLRGAEARPFPTMVTRGLDQLVLRDGPWKLIHTPEKNVTQLHHLDRDPGEQHDLAATEPRRLAEMRSRLERQVEAGSSRPGAQGRATTWTGLFREREERNARVKALLSPEP